MTIKITSCSCFFDQCIYLTTCRNPDVDFNSITANDRDIFIKEKKHCIFDRRISYVEYVISCFDCFVIFGYSILSIAGLLLAILLITEKSLAMMFLLVMDSFCNNYRLIRFC